MSLVVLSTTFHTRRHRGGVSGARQRLMHCVKAAISKANNDTNQHHLIRTGLLTVQDRKGDNRQGTSTKSGGICGSLAGTDPHCSTWILESTQFFHWIPGIGSLRDWLLQKQAQLLPTVSCLDMINRDSHSINLMASRINGLED